MNRDLTTNSSLPPISFEEFKVYFDKMEQETGVIIGTLPTPAENGDSSRVCTSRMCGYADIYIRVDVLMIDDCV